MLWYSHNIREDEKELFEAVRDVAEYMMSFVNPEAVSKIKASRDDENNMSSTDNPEDLMRDIAEGSSSIFDDIEEIKNTVGLSQTNNNRELREGVNFQSELFDLTRKY